MNTKLVTAATDVIHRAQMNGTVTAAGLAIALYSAQLLQSPETVAEMERTARAEAAPYWRQRAYRAENVQWDNALAPGGEVCAHPDCGQPVESEPCPEHSPAVALAQLRARVTELETRLAEYERPADEDPIAYTLTDKAAVADGFTRLIAPIQAMRADEAGGAS